MKVTPELKRKIFLQLLKNNHIPPPKLEYMFSESRQFRADYFWHINGISLMLELQGGVEGSAKSGHNTVAGMKRDREKLNLATSEGIFTMQVSYTELCSPKTIRQIKQCLKLV